MDSYACNLELILRISTNCLTITIVNIIIYNNNTNKKFNKAPNASSILQTEALGAGQE